MVMSSTMRPVAKMPVEAQAADALREAIVQGVLPLGARITEIKLSEEMQLSRATIRTALHQLVKEGLVIQVPYTGWTVIPLSSKDVRELFTLRSALERLAAQITTKSLTDAGRAELGASFSRLQKACSSNSHSQAAEADFDLHKTIVDLSGHKRLAAQYQLIEQQIRMIIRSSDGLVSDLSKLITQHEPIVEGILAGDPERAGREAEYHIISEGEILYRFVAESENPESSRGKGDRKQIAKATTRRRKLAVARPNSLQLS